MPTYGSADTNALIWDLKERPTKRMEIGYLVCVLDFYKILFDLHLFTFFFNGENLRGYTGVRVTKRYILIFHFTIYPISNILLFFYHFI